MRDLSKIELPALRDGRLVVRPYAPGDIPAVAALCNDPTIARWETLPSPYSPADAKVWVGDAQRRWQQEAWAGFVVCDALSGELVGSNGLRISVRRESGEIGFMTMRAARRRGVASGGVRLLVDWCFGELGLGRLQIRADARNEASLRTIAACGFQYEGLLRAYDVVRGERTDDLIYSLLPGDPRAPLVPLPDPRLEDGRLVVRPFEPDDIPAVRHACDDPDVAHWIHLLPHPYGLADAERFVIDSRRRLAAGDRARLAVADAETGELLGSIGLDLFADRQAAEIGYWVKREARRRGVALAAARLLVRWAFEEVGVERLEILTYPGNAASQALAEKLGFRRECLLRGFLGVEPGKDRTGRAEPLPDGSLPPRDDQVQFALLKDDRKG